jgi:methanogenic corrinoid protein MtbC1
LNIFNFFKDVIKTKSKKEAVVFAHEHFLNDKSLIKAMLIQDQIQDYITQIFTNRKQTAVTAITTNIEEGIDKQKQYQIIKCLMEGLPLNVANRDKGNTYKTIQNEECSIHPSSFLLQNTNDANR